MTGKEYTAGIETPVLRSLPAFFCRAVRVNEIETALSREKTFSFVAPFEREILFLNASDETIKIVVGSPLQTRELLCV